MPLRQTDPSTDYPEHDAAWDNPAATPPSSDETLSAAFRQGNSVVSLFSNQARRSFPAVEGYSPSQDITQDDPYLAQRDRFVGSASPAETAAIKRQIDMEEADKRTLASSGLAGTVASMVAGTADPTLWWAPARLGRGVLAGRQLLRGAAEGALTFGAQSSMQEALLQGSQETRTAGESAGNIASATILGGLLGPASALLTKEEHAALAAKVDADRAATERHAAGLPQETPQPPTKTDENIPTQPEITPPTPTDIAPPAATTPQVESTRSPAERLTAAGTDRAAFDRVRSDLAKMSKDEVNAVQHEYIGGREAWPTKREALTAIENAFREREYQTVKMTQVEKASKFAPDNYAPPATGRVSSDDLRSLPAADVIKRVAEITGLLPEKTKTAALTALDKHYLRQDRFEAKIAAGAEATSAESLAAAPKTPAAQDLQLAPAFGVEKVGLDAKTRGMNSPLGTARRATAELGELPIETMGNLRGETTTIAGGPPVETQAKIDLRTAHIGAMADMRDAWRDLRFQGNKAPWFAEFRDRMGMLNRPADLPTYEDFTKMVGEAMTRGDTHTIPQVQQAAQALRRRMEPWADRAEDALQGFAKREGEPYYPHDWNKKLIREQRPEFVDFLSNYFNGEQATKRGIQTRMQALSDQLAQAETKIKRLTGKAERTEANETALDAAHLEAATTRERIEAEIGKWAGKSAKDAKAALGARAKAEAERQRRAAARGQPVPTNRLTGADAEVDKAVKRILESRQDLSAEDLRLRAQETVDHILGTPDGRIYSEGGDFLVPRGSDSLRSSEAHRTLNVSNAEAWPWINQNAEEVSRRWFNTVVPDVLLAERFGDVEMKAPIKQILDEHAALSDTKRGDAKGVKELDAAKDRAINDLAFMRDKLRGVLNIPANQTDARIKQISGAVRNFNVLTSLGMAGVNSITDAGGVMMRYGLTKTFGDGFFPYVRSLMSGGELNREALVQAKAAGIAIDWEMAARHHEISGVLDNYAPSSPIERALQWGADKMQLVNMLAPWTDRIKTITMTVAAPELKRGMEALVAGTADQRQLRLLGAANIDNRVASRILKQYDQYGVMIDGTHLPNVMAWTDQRAREAFQGALIREADTAVVTPGIGDSPNWMSQPIMGLLGQFKSFTAASHTRILIANLQRRDAETLGGLVGMLGLGMLSYAIGGMTGGSKTSDKPADWIKEAMSRSNALGWLEEGNAFASKMTRGQLDLYRLTGSDHMMSRYAGRSVVDQMLGPTVGKIDRLRQVTGAASSGDWTASDTHALRQLIAMQNLIWLRGALNEIEKGFNSSLNIPEKAQ